MHADAGGYLLTSVLPLLVSISGWLPWPWLAKQPLPRSGAERGSAMPASLPRPTASPAQTHTINEHENLQQILKADEFFLPLAVSCKGGLWILSVPLLLIKSPNFPIAKLCVGWLPWGKKPPAAQRRCNNC